MRILKSFSSSRIKRFRKKLTAGTIKKRRPFRFIFIVTFDFEEDMQAYMSFWKKISKLIQKEKGALGTRLHRVAAEEGLFAVLAIAEWTSHRARVSAYRHIAEIYPPSHYIHWQADRFNGRLTGPFMAKEIAMVLPSRWKQ